jgi:hypothetical protein
MVEQRPCWYSAPTSDERTSVGHARPRPPLAALPVRDVLEDVRLFDTSVRLEELIQNA